MKRIVLLLCCLAGVAGCDLIPRGAGLQTEVLAGATNGTDRTVPEFAVEIVTQQNLATFVTWPDVNSTHLPWISRIDQPNTRSIASGDTLSITIWTNEDNGLLTTAGQRSVTLPAIEVSPAGSIFLPYVGNLRISGMSPERAREHISESYESLSPSAQVQLEVAEGRARAASVISGVASPGTYPLPDNDYTILDLITAGGGVSPGLNNPQIRLQRGGKMYGVSVALLLNTPRLNTTLEGGDRVFVEEESRTFLSLGAAGSEAIHRFPKDRISALEALAIIGGISDSRADAGGILILRSYPVAAITADRTGPDHPRTVFTLDLTTADGLFSADKFSIQPGDLVYVTESPVTAINSIFALFGSFLGFGNRLN